MSAIRIVLTNVPAGRGATIARTLVEERLAACVNIFAAQSVYHWKGDICHDAEETLLIKVGTSRLAALGTRLVELHPYDLPEILALAVDAEHSLEEYIRWVVDHTEAPFHASEPGTQGERT